MLLFRSGVWLLGALLSLTPAVHGQNPDPNEYFCYLYGHMSRVPSNLPKCFYTLFTDQKLKYTVVLKDSMLYIVGGWMGYYGRYRYFNGPNPALRSFDVSKSFQTSLESREYFLTEPIRPEVPGVGNAALFPTDSGFDLTFGDWYPYNISEYGERDPPIENKTWQYEIAAQKWTNTDIKLKDWPKRNASRRLSSSMTAWIPSLKKGFLFGGAFVAVNETWLNVTAELEVHNGLITYDQVSNTWTNKTTQLGGIADGGLVHITTATDEVLIRLGGRGRWASKMKSFSEINIYSTKKSKWCTQHLPSEALVPAPRSAFCAALKSAPDGSSHQIYIIGGIESSPFVDQPEGPTVSSVWVLSIPSFEWAQLPITTKTTAADPRARISPKCQAIGEHYIFLYGGMNTVGHSGGVVCDRKANAAFLLDVNTLTWTDEFTPNNGTYQIPRQVLGLIGGDRSGGSAKKEPANGWSDPDLKTIMTLKPAIRVGGGPGSGSKPSRTNVGAIAGGTVAGVAAVLFGLLGGMVLRRRHHRRRLQLPQDHKESCCPVGLMERNQANKDGVFATELPSGEVAREMDTGYGSGEG
ncbi:hypothetical protein HOY82DRAFT_636937 [Tuber indicum]|nr:hypothetical protein HOY82DRAFT_636937 [Tuber indicum]